MVDNVALNIWCLDQRVLLIRLVHCDGVAAAEARDFLDASFPVHLVC